MFAWWPLFCGLATSTNEQGLNMTRNESLENLGAGDVVRLMLHHSGMTQDELAEAMGWPPGNAVRIFDPHANYWPSLPSLPRLCAVTRSTILVDWILARMRAGGGEVACLPTDPAALPLAVAELARELGDVSREVLAALAPDSERGVSVTPVEARRILRELEDVMSRCTALISGLRALISQGRVQ